MNLPQYQEIEEAYQYAKKIIERIPERTETKRAAEHLEIAQSLTYEARERTKGEDQP